MPRKCVLTFHERRKKADSIEYALTDMEAIGRVVQHFVRECKAVWRSDRDITLSLRFQGKNDGLLKESFDGKQEEGGLADTGAGRRRPVRVSAGVVAAGGAVLPILYWLVQR